MNPLLPLSLAITNRLRGSDGEGWLKENRVPVSFIGTLLSGIIFGVGTGIWWQWLIVIIAYFIGEAAPGPNWGEACGSIISHAPDYKKQYVNLAIRGMIWFAPIFGVLAYFGTIGILPAIIATTIVGALFPVSMELGRHVPYRAPYLRSAWEWGEFIYGLFQGLALWILI